jgi:hypothetical protein
MTTAQKAWGKLLHLEGNQKIECLGEIITWDPPTETSLTVMRTALKNAALEESLADELGPRAAFVRACNRMKEDRLIRLLDHDADYIYFQFTRERKDLEEAAASDSADAETTNTEPSVGPDNQKRLKYDFEAVVSVDKKTGKVGCKLPYLRQLAQTEFDAAVERRNGHDVGEVIRKAFKAHGDLFPIRKGGAVYLVLGEYVNVVDQVQQFLKEIGGYMPRYPIPAGSQQGDSSVQTAVTDGLAQMIKEHEEAIANFDPSKVRVKTLEAQAKQIKETRRKIEAYAAYLKDSQVGLLASLAQADTALKEKVKLAARANQESGSTPQTVPVQAQEQLAASNEKIVEAAVA